MKLKCAYEGGKKMGRWYPIVKCSGKVTEFKKTGLAYKQLVFFCAAHAEDYTTHTGIELQAVKRF